LDEVCGAAADDARVGSAAPVVQAVRAVLGVAAAFVSDSAAEHTAGGVVDRRPLVPGEVYAALAQPVDDVLAVGLQLANEMVGTGERGAAAADVDADTGSA